MLNHDEIVGKLARLYELQDKLERDQQNLLALHKKRSLLTTNGDFTRIKGILNTLDQINSLSKELSDELLEDAIHSFLVPGETYHYLYVPKNKHLVYGFVTPGQFALPGDRCHVFKIYLREEESHLNLTWDENDDSDLV